MPGSSASISDATVTQTLLGKFTTTDPDTTCSVTSPVASAYEVRKVTSPANPQQPGREIIDHSVNAYNFKAHEPPQGYI
ncbi:hypothetical protein DPMN_020099 [Dreissena polymorpha]|uniref:Uncharacterized protein n=1 Tax=Dreissena polymorpha TaxID=45954 RepID=A0A9D4JW68_DREPO|nr:hypothetical protein DPMN_128210 [Dreissena polymorpha]KAH3895930.1 hypothetical protein DPMN_020099 [Dreissena polymorpha]